MSETVLIGILSLAGTLLGSLFGILAANKLVNYRLAQLEKKVEVHNQVIDRVYKLERSEAIFHEEMEVVNDKIKGLAAYHK